MALKAPTQSQPNTVKSWGSETGGIMSGQVVLRSGVNWDRVNPKS